MDWFRYFKEEAIKDFGDYVSPGKLKAYRALGLELVPSKREGCFIYDQNGRRFINCRSSGGVFNLGHRPPEMIKALTEALEVFDIGDHLLLSAARAALARKLADLTPGDIHYSVFGVGGGEAVDLSIKLARAHTGRPGVVSALGGYHGHTGFALATGDEDFKKHFGPLAPGFTQIPFGDAEALEDAVDDSTAAVIFETIPATFGIKIPPPDFFGAARRICDERGALMIIDEVQAGLGRTGRLWAIEEWDVVPDIMVLAKGLAGSLYPMSVTCFRKHLNRFFESHPFIHVSTMGGSELGCAVTMALLERVSDPGFLEHVRKMGDLFGDGLEAIRLAHPDALEEVTRRGLMIGLKMKKESHGPLLTILLAKYGVIALFAHNDPSVMIIMPPLIISEEEVKMVLDALEKSYIDMEKLNA